MEPLESISRTEKVLEMLKEHITSGEFAIGDKFSTEQEICKRLKVGRSTVREAYRVLQTMGYIQLKAGRGAFVSRISHEEPSSVVDWFAEHALQIMDFMEVRMSLEPLAVKLAIERADEKEIQNLEDIHREFCATLSAGDPVKLSMLDEAFHNALFEATHNGLLIELNRKIAAAFAVYRSKAFAVPEHMGNAHGPHQRIIEAIKQRNTGKAQAEILKHLEISMQDIKRVVERNEEEQNFSK